MVHLVLVENWKLRNKKKRPKKKKQSRQNRIDKVDHGNQRRKLQGE